MYISLTLIKTTHFCQTTSATYFTSKTTKFCSIFRDFRPLASTKKLSSSFIQELGMSKLKMQVFDCDFSKLSDDLVLNILSKLEEDPRHWARLCCVSTRFSLLIRNVCCKTKCCQTIPTVVSDLLSGGGATSSDAPWDSMYKLAVCCPGLVLSGILLENLDFGLERELGPEEEYAREINGNATNSGRADSLTSSASDRADNSDSYSGRSDVLPPSFDNNDNASDCGWSLYDDLLFDTMYDESGSREAQIWIPESGNMAVAKPECDYSVSKKKKKSKSVKSHLASGVWNLSREQGNKLLASRFKGDCLYICDWPGCIHLEEKRNYMLFRGIFKNFKQSRVWRTINDGKRKMIDLNCAFCEAKQTWDLHSAFCLRSHFGFHDDGEPVVRAYVCENGHVSGAWTDWPLYT